MVDGRQAVITGTDARAIPTTKTRAEVAQQPLEDLPLFGHATAAREAEEAARPRALFETLAGTP